MKNFSLIVTVTSFFLLFSVISSSATPINKWNFDIQYGFTSYTGITEYGCPVKSDWSGYGIEGSRNNSYFDAPTKLEWGEKTKYERQVGTKTIGYWKLTWGGGWRYIEKEIPIKEKYWGYTGETSSISVTPGSLNETIQPGDKVEGITLQHKNSPIISTTYTRSTFLNTATLSSRLTVTPEGLPSISWNKDFDIKFYETPNRSNHPADIFMVTGFKSFEKIFKNDGYSYKATFGFEDLDQLTDEQTDLLGLDSSSDYYGFATEETGETKQTSWFSVDRVASPTPEPSTLVLFGLGIVGFAGIIRKKLK